MYEFPNQLNKERTLISVNQFHSKLQARVDVPLTVPLEAILVFSIPAHMRYSESASLHLQHHLFKF